MFPFVNDVFLLCLVYIYVVVNEISECQLCRFINQFKLLDEVSKFVNVF